MLNDGGALSSTQIVWSHETEFVHPSVAVHVRVIIRLVGQRANTTASVNVIVMLAQLSVAVAVPVKLVPV